VISDAFMIESGLSSRRRAAILSTSGIAASRWRITEPRRPWRGALTRDSWLSSGCSRLWWCRSPASWAVIPDHQHRSQPTRFSCRPSSSGSTSTRSGLARASRTPSNLRHDADCVEAIHRQLGGNLGQACARLESV